MQYFRHCFETQPPIVPCDESLKLTIICLLRHLVMTLSVSEHGTDTQFYCTSRFMWNKTDKFQRWCIRNLSARLLRCHSTVTENRTKPSSRVSKVFFSWKIIKHRYKITWKHLKSSTWAYWASKQFWSRLEKVRVPCAVCVIVWLSLTRCSTTDNSWIPQRRSSNRNNTGLKLPNLRTKLKTSNRSLRRCHLRSMEESWNMYGICME